MFGSYQDSGVAKYRNIAVLSNFAEISVRDAYRLSRGEDNIAFPLKNASILWKPHNKGYLGGILAKKRLKNRNLVSTLSIYNTSTLFVNSVICMLAHTN